MSTTKPREMSSVQLPQDVLSQVRLLPDMVAGRAGGGGSLMRCRMPLCLWLELSVNGRRRKEEGR
jgi:hypothetical protein